MLSGNTQQPVRYKNSILIMLQSFLIGLREALQCSLMVVLLMGYPGVMPRIRWLAGGMVLAFMIAFSLGYIPTLALGLPDIETWNFLRHVTEIVVFYLGVLFLALGRRESRPDSIWPRWALVLMGFWLFFFESQSSGFVIRDLGTMSEAARPIAILFILGIAAGFAPLAFAGKLLEKVPLKRGLTLPGLFVALGALKFLTGGMGEVESADILISLQRGFQVFLENAVEHLQYILMLQPHRFIDVPLTGLFEFLAGDRTAASLMFIFVAIPPLLVLLDLFSAPDPVLKDITVAAQRRLKTAFFRAELVYKSIPAIVALLIVVVSLHAVNVSMNPMYEPEPITVRAGENEEVLRLPLVDRLGNFTDGKIRKYLYYYGNKKVIFLAVMKPDGTIGVALDECEICKPSEWNTSAQGYAQRGETLVCKYCMTPIPTSTVNKPGGCNPIPLSFRTEGDHIVIVLEDLIGTYNEVQKLEKKGSHL